MSREFADGQIVPGTRYRVLGHLGSGGMGSVYLVEHTELGKSFVLKALFRELAGRKDLVGRLRQEWRALARLNHANIVNVTDAGTSDNGVPFYVMERVEGETLADLLRREHALGIPRAIGLTIAVLEGLAAAHEIGIVHRDVKPPNIFVVAGGGVRLLDFGIAKLADQSAEVITARGVAIGTPRYMSPEQAKGRSVDARADLYAVGLVLYEAIAGAGPFDDARDANELLLSHLTKPVPPLSNFHRGVSAQLDDIVSSLLAKDPSARPSSAKQVAASLKALIKRAATLPSTGGATPEAHYDAVTQGQVTALPSTRPDGVAGRSSQPPTTEPPTVEAPLVAGSAVRRSVPPAVGDTTLIGGTPVTGGTTLSATADTEAGLEWAKEGFSTIAAESEVASLGVEHTAIAAAPPSAVAVGPAGDEDRTLPIDEPAGLPPNEAPTRTSVPAAALVTPRPVARSMPDVSPLPNHFFAETPPPFMTATPPPSSSTPQVSRAPLYLGLLSLLILIGGVGAFVVIKSVRGHADDAPIEAVAAQPASTADPASTAVDPAAEPASPAGSPAAAPASTGSVAEQETPSPSAGPRPSGAAPSAVAQGVAPKPVAAPPAAAEPKPRVENSPQKTPEKPAAKPAVPTSKPKPVGSKLPASGL
ncbi:MAG: protein kinase [Myxococcales bacterium]|nr:protein kinase [Myxococcales bacterium]